MRVQPVAQVDLDPERHAAGHEPPRHREPQPQHGGDDDHDRDEGQKALVVGPRVGLPGVGRARLGLVDRGADQVREEHCRPHGQRREHGRGDHAGAIRAQEAEEAPERGHYFRKYSWGCAGRALRQLPPPAHRAHHPRLVLLALPALEDRPRLSALSAPAGGGMQGMGATAALPLVAAVLSGWVAQPPAKVARTEVGAARVAGAAYVVGGFSPRGNATLATVERYDLRRGTTRIVAPMPIALNHAPAVALGGGIYAAGGASRGKPLDTLEVYDVATDRWGTGPPMGRAREHLACAVAAGKLYVLAGRASGQGNFTTAERFDPATNRWESLPDMAKARGGIAAAAVGDDVVVLGGEESAGTIAAVEAYNTASGGWRALSDLRTPRHGLGAVAYRGRVYAIEGGTSPGFSFSRTVEALVARRASSS